MNPLLFIDELILGGGLVAAAGNRLLVKYGLGREPDATAIQHWAATARTLMRSGLSEDAAGEAAARQVFPDFRTRVYAGEGDTIDTLLRLADQK